MTISQVTVNRIKLIQINQHSPQFGYYLCLLIKHFPYITHSCIASMGKVQQIVTTGMADVESIELV